MPGEVNALKINDKSHNSLKNDSKEVGKKATQLLSSAPRDFFSSNSAFLSSM